LNASEKAASVSAVTFAADVSVVAMHVSCSVNWAKPRELA
jgi:hypothetical protein